MLKRRLQAIGSLLAIFVLVGLMSSTAYANPIEKSGRFGLGGGIGYPGLVLSTNTFLTPGVSLQANAIMFWDAGGFALELDFPFWLHEVNINNVVDFTWYAGPGALFGYWGKGNLGRYGTSGGNLIGVVKGVIGPALQFKTAPVDLVFQFSPGIAFHSGGISPWFSGMIASRYYF